MTLITNKIILGANDSVTTPYVDSISTYLSASSTDQQIPTAKSVYILEKWVNGTLYDDGGTLYPTIIPKTVTDIVRLPGFIMGASGTRLIDGVVTGISISSLDSKIPTAKACYTAIANAVSGLASQTYVDNAISTATADLATEDYVDTQINTAVADLATEDYVDNAISGFATITSTSVSLGTTGWTLSGGYYQKSVTVSGVTSTNKVLVSPTNNRSQYDEYANTRMMLLSQTTNSLTFQALFVPTVSITVNVLIIN